MNLFLSVFLSLSLFLGIALEIPHEEVQSYIALQKELAEKIPKESERPVVDLKLIASYTKKEIGILGGMGPLSDARIIEKVASHTSHPIHLLSIPPPRTFLEISLGIYSYLYQVYQFLNEDLDRIYLASNTAHIHYDFLNWMGKGNVVNLTIFVANYTKDQLGSPCTLLLGTEKIQEHKLYEALFSERNVEYLTVDKITQKRLQEVIDQVKQGKQTKELEDEIYQMILEKKEGAKAVLLGCTELSMLLENHHEKLREMGLVVIDTESLFVQKILEDLGS